MLEVVELGINEMNIESVTTAKPDAMASWLFLKLASAWRVAI